MLLLTDWTSAPDDHSIGIEYYQKNMWNSIADTYIDFAYEKYCRYLHQYSKSITDIIGSNINNPETGPPHLCTIWLEFMLLLTYFMNCLFI